jgi:hypothetical protein
VLPSVALSALVTACIYDIQIYSISVEDPNQLQLVIRC